MIRFGIFLVALQETGARPGEIARVTALHVDLSAGVWIFHEHKTAKRTRLRRPRVIILTPKMVDMTARLLKLYPEGPLFRTRKGKAWNKNSIRMRFRRVRKKLKLGDDVVVYLYRHSYVTDALENGVGLAQVCELVGHVNTNMVMRHYAHLSQRREHLRGAVLATQNVRSAAGMPPSSN